MTFLNYLPDFLAGLWITASVSLLSFAGALVLGILGALGRRSKIRVFRIISGVYVEVIRNTPSLVQIFIVFFGLPTFGIYVPAYLAGVIALAINGGAYTTEIVRAGLEAIPPGQLEAAKVLGLSKKDTLFFVVLPQALRTVYPPIVNEVLQIILGSSLLSTIALNELTGVAMIVNSMTFETMQAFGTALVLYLLLTIVVSFAAGLLAKVLFHPPLKVSTRMPRPTFWPRRRVLDNTSAGGVA